MNLYLIVLLLLAAGAVLEWFKPKYQQKIFTVCWCDYGSGCPEVWTGNRLCHL